MQLHLSLSNTKKDLNKKIEWFEVYLEKLLNDYTKIT